MKIYSNTALSSLVAVIVIGAAALVLASSATIVGIDIIQSTFRQAQGGETFASADGCVEHALSRLRIDSSYAGESLSIEDVVCTITVQAQIVRVIAVRDGGEYGRTIEATFQLSSGIQITDWREMTD